MPNPFDLSLFIKQRRSRDTRPNDTSLSPQDAFSAWVMANDVLVSNVSNALAGPMRPHFFLAMHEPHNPLPQKFMEVLCAQPELNYFEGTESFIPGGSFLDALLDPRPLDALSAKWSSSPNAYRFALNVVAVLWQVSSNSDVSETKIKHALTQFDTLFNERDPAKAARDGKAIRALVGPLSGSRHALEFPNTRLPAPIVLDHEMERVDHTCDAITPHIERAFGVENKWATHTLKRMNVWEASSGERTSMQVKVCHDEARTQDRFDLTRKILFPSWVAPSHIDTLVERWVKQSHSYVRPASGIELSTPHSSRRTP